MKVLMFGWEFPPHISGGLGTACFGLTKALNKQGVDITFVVPKVKETLSDAPVKLLAAQDVLTAYEETNESPKLSHQLLKYIQVSSMLRPYLDVKSYKDFLKKIKSLEELSQNGQGKIDLTGDYGPNLLAEVIRYALVGRELGKKADFDVIHAHEWMTFLAGIEAKKASGKKLIVHIHATEVDRSGEYPCRDIFGIEKYGMEMADKVIAVSKRTKSILVNKYDINPDKIEVVYNAVEKDDSQITELAYRVSSNQEKIVLFLGRITMQKGPEYFIEAADLVLKKMRNVRFVMAGSGDMARKMVEKVAGLKLHDRFYFTGFLNGQERERLFSMSSLYVMPSVSEPFGITPLEAMKHGVPIIVSKQSGVAEILDNTTTVDFWDTKKLAASIIEMLTDNELALTLRENARLTLESIDWDQSAKHVKEIYHSLV